MPGAAPRYSRREFLGLVAATVPAIALPAHLKAEMPADRVLKFAHLHTGEHLAVEYFRGGQFQPEALAAVNHVLRDFRTGDVHVIDPALCDLLFGLARATDTSQPFQVISGYRSPATNAMLRQKSEGVAAGSLHMSGRAIDIRLADVPLVSLRNAALAIGRGGVGFYPSSDFVHVDTGPQRRW